MIDDKKIESAKEKIYEDKFLGCGEMVEAGTFIKLNKEPAIGGLRPAVDPMMVSVSEIFGAKTVGVILTGMGHDGAKGMQAIKRMKGLTIAEDQSTAVVFGMPKAAIEAGVVDIVLPLPRVAEGIVQCLKRGGK